MWVKNQEYFLTSERLGFRQWRPDDFELARGLWGDLQVTHLIDARGQLSDEQVGQKLQQEISTAAKYGVQYWPIFLRSTGTHVGCCGLRSYDLSLQVYEIGFHIRSRMWGQGYATEAATRVIEFAFEDLDAQALFAGHNPKNETSRKLLEKLGFQYTHDEFYEPTGLHHPSYILQKNQPGTGN